MGFLTDGPQWKMAAMDLLCEAWMSAAILSPTQKRAQGSGTKKQVRHAIILAISFFGLSSVLLVSSAGANDQKLTTSLLNNFRNDVTKCWNVPQGASEVPNLTVQVRIKLSRNGTIVGTPTVLNPTKGDVIEAVENSVRKAIVRCAPYRTFKDYPQLYDAWSDLTVLFLPSME